MFPGCWGGGLARGLGWGVGRNWDKLQTMFTSGFFSRLADLVETSLLLPTRGPSGIT